MARSLPDFSDAELGWLAGLLEGEGYFGIIRNHGKLNGDRTKVYLYPRIGVSMTDRDVIERVARFWSGKVSVVKPAGVSKKTSYRTHLFGKRAVRMMRLLRPLMGERRRKQIDNTLGTNSKAGAL